MEAPRQPRLLDQVRERCRVKHYSLRTEQAYIHWIRRFILFHGKRHPRDMGAAEVEAFPTHLAVKDDVAPSTQSQTLAGILFLYCEVLAVELPWLENVTCAATQPGVDPRSGIRRRHHLHETAVQRAVKTAVRASGILNAGHQPHASAQVRDASAGRWIRHPHGAGTAGAQRCAHHANLHACAQPGRAGGAPPAGSGLRRVLLAGPWRMTFPVALPDCSGWRHGAQIARCVSEKQRGTPGPATPFPRPGIGPLIAGFGHRCARSIIGDGPSYPGFSLCTPISLTPLPPAGCRVPLPRTKDRNGIAG
jgi:hypothetical protein